MGSRIRAALLAAVVTVGGLTVVAPPAAAAGSLTITPTTWDIVGLDSNKPSVTNGRPNEFPVAAKVCNTGDAAATSVQTAFAWTTANTNLSLANANATRSVGTLAPGACANVTYNVLVNRNQQSFNNRTRGYQITATAAGGLAASTPANREVYVEKLVSQSRNSVVGITGPACTGGSCTVYRGQTYRFTLTSKTATQGYEQLETFVNFPDSIFEIQDVTTTYAAPAGGRNDRVYADACGWDPVTTSPTYRSCVGPTRFSGGKAGGNPITTHYTVKVVGTGSGTLSGLVYDFSGSSFHYNADFGTGVNAVPFTASDAADLSLTKTHTGAFVRGGTGTYRLTVSNAGPATSGAITVTDTLPAGLTYRSFAGTGWSCSGCSSSSQTVTLTRAALASGTSSSVDLTVDAGAGAASSVTNTAAVSQTTSSTLNDPTPGNNTVSDATTVANPTDADLVVTKTRDDVMTPGGEETYTISVRNDGPGTVTGPITMTDVLPQGLTYVSATGDGWTCSASGQTVTCTRPGGLAALESAPPIALVLSVAPDAPARSTNTTSATGSIDNDPNDPNNVDVLDVVRVGSADLWIEKSHTGSFSRGGNGKYTIVVGNRGPNAAETPRVVDTLPAGLTYTSATGTGWTCSNGGQTVTCTAASDLAADSTAPALTVNVAVAAGAPSVVTNRATVCSVQSPGSVTGCPDQNQGTAEVAPSDNAAEDVTATVAPTDLSLVKTASVASVAPGTSYDYTLTVTNNGPNPATNVTIVDTLPVHVDAASITTNPGPSNTSTPPYCDVTNREVTCSMGTVPATAGSNSATATITVKALPTAAGRTIVNAATVFSDLGDTAPGNDGASAPVSVTGTLVNAAPVAADETLSVPHRSVTGGDVVLSATDADGDPLTFELDGADGGAGHGTVTISGNVATYVPDGDFTGTDTFRYRANDGAETSAPATVTVTVTNAAPSAADRSANVRHRSTGTAIVLDGTDADGDALTFSLDGADGGATRGSVTISGDTATYVPSGDFVGSDSFRYRVGDGAATSAPATVTVTLTNAAPTLASAALSPRTVGTSGMLTATAVTPADADGDDLTYTYVWRRTRGSQTDVVTTTAGTASTTDTFALTGTVAGDEIQVSVTANDGHADSPTRTDSVVVGNSAPSATGQAATTDEDTPKTLTLSGSDPDGDDPSFEITALPAHGVLYDGGDATGTPVSALPHELAGATVTYRPDPGYSGPDEFSFRATDGETASGTAQVALTVVPVNDAPTAGAGSLTVPGNATSGQLDLAALAADEETSDAALTYEVVSAPAGGTATVSGSTVTYTRTAAGRDDDGFTFKVVDRGDPDGCGLPLPGTCTAPLESNVAAVTVSFDNATPDAAPDAVTTAEDVAVTITLAATDDDGDDLTYSVTSLPARGSLHAGADADGDELTAPAALPGTRVTYRPDPDYNGDDSFEFTASDGSATSAPAEVGVTVTPVNDRPEASPGTIDVDGGSVTGSVDLATLADDAETGDDDLVYEVVSDPADGDVSLTGSTLTYTRTAPGRDADELTFAVTDRGDPDDCGTASPACAAELTSAPAKIAVTFGNAAPTAAPGTATTPEDTAVAVELDGADPDGDELTYVVTSLPSEGHLRSGGDDVSSVPFELPGRSVTYVPDDDYNGTDSFGFETSDGRLDSGAATVSVTVTPVNDRPAADDGGISVAPGGSTAQLDLAELASDVETADGDLAYDIVSQPGKGDATLAGSTVTYTRTAPGRDADELTFEVTDRGDPDDCGTPGDGCAAARTSEIATVSVAFDYTRPTADAQQLTTPEDTPVTVALTGAAPSDADTTFEIRSLPQHGALFQGQTQLGTVPFELAGAGVAFVPDPDYTGTDSFTFVTSGLQASAPATVSVTVTPVNDPPQATGGTVTAPPGAATTITLKAADVDDDALEIALTGGPAHGAIGPVAAPVCKPSGGGSTCTAAVVYTPQYGFSGADELTFFAVDGTEESGAATMAIEVPAVSSGDGGGTVTPSPIPTPSASPSASPSATPTPDPTPTPTQSATPQPTESPDVEEPCGAPIEVEADGRPIVGTPCGELITVHADVPATIEALGGNDTIFVFGSGEVHVSAGGGDDQVSCLDAAATVLGGGGDDAVECGTGNDVLRGGRGSDAIAAGDGDDVVSGGRGDDRMDGGAGNDLLIGGRGGDALYGGGGDDVLKGQAKTDLLRAGAGADLLRGSGGDDVEYGGKGADKVQAGPGDDRLWGGRGADRLQGNEGADRIQGGGGDDFIRGRAGSDVLRGRGGDDVLRGGPGDDVLRGVAGDDELQSGSGRNEVDGGLGVDLCVVGTQGNVWTGCERRLKRRF